MGSYECGEPLLLAEYTSRMNIIQESIFQWWVPHVLSQKERLLNKVKTIYHKNDLKFGIRVPKSIIEALALDKANNNKLWEHAINLEMTNVKIAFKFLDKGAPPPVGYKGIRCHIIFDVKMDLTRKARFVAGGHMTDPLSFLLEDQQECDSIHSDRRQTVLTVQLRPFPSSYFVSYPLWTLQ